MRFAGADRGRMRAEAESLASVVYQAAPTHPGGAHYLIHSVDSPSTAERGLDAARTYARIAPETEHAHHMPSHIFVKEADRALPSLVEARRGAAFGGATAPPAPPIRAPTVTFDYSNLIDQPCYAAAKLPRDTALIAATLRRMPAWRGTWSRKAPELFRAAVATTRGAFMFTEAKAAIITCPTFPSMSLPLMINARLLFRDDTALVENDTMHFVSLLFHENLHRYIGDRIRTLPDSTTPLLRKYAAEAPVVLAHVHLFALMDTVYRQVRGASTVLRPTVPSGPIAGGSRGVNDLDRAREIVRTEGVAAFVRELVPVAATSPLRP
jgi:hypothetical protein